MNLSNCSFIRREDDEMKSTSNVKKEELWILIGIPVLFLIGSLLHFLYEWSGECFLVGLIAPVNESVWEHTKMVVLPIILWWSIYYFVHGKKDSINKRKWFTGELVALLTAIITIPLIYYFYTEAFGVELLWVDILILGIAIILGQLLGLHVYRYGKGLDPEFAIFLIVLILIVYVVFTIAPLKLPIFQNPVDGSYGIQKQ